MKISSYPIVGFYIIAASAIAVLSCRSNISTEDAQTQQLPKKVDFNHHIKPILSDRCYKCHGPDKKVREANLRFDTEEGAFALLDSATNSRAIVPGNVKKSLLVKRVSSSDPDFMMPRPESNLSLSNYEIKLLKKWIEQGAEWKPHWAFIPPEKRTLPEIKNKIWSKNPIDHFTLVRMEQRGMRPSDEAEKTKLIRRLSFDLTGLPPILDEVDAFLADDSADAYEKMVDHYLASPAYGERMAVPWLDLARYADTHGYQDDYDRSMWPWRDWVINAFNANMPFDQFTTWQLAGDLLPDPTYDQKLATGFNRNHMITQEGGVVPEEYRVEYVADRTQTTATTFLGLTMQCSRCHDHKYDPILQKEFYQLFSFFNNVPEKGLDGNTSTPAPFLPLPKSKIDSINGFAKSIIEAEQQKLAELKEQKRGVFQEWRDGQPAFAEASADKLAVGSSAVRQSTVNSPHLTLSEVEGSTVLPKGLIGHYNLDYFENDQTTNLANPSSPGKAIIDVVETQGKFSGAVEFTGDNYLDLGNTGDFIWSDPFSFSCWFMSQSRVNTEPIFQKLDTTGEADRGYRIDNSQKWIGVNLGGRRIAVRTMADFPIDRWCQLTVTYDGSGKAKGIKIYFDGEHQPLLYQKEESIVGWMRTNAPLEIGKSLSLEFIGAFVDELQIYNRDLAPEEITDLVGYDPIAPLFAKSELSDNEVQSMYYQYLHHHNSDYQDVVNDISHEKRMARFLRRQLWPTMIMEDMDTLRPAYVLNRGMYDAHGERVYPGTPQQIMEFAEDLPQNRLGLAKWILDPQNPLTSRVIINRFWQLIFGEGIVSTLDDFGSQGALPTHPELLDWLAVEFIESGWDVKHMLKLMVSSATYRQSSSLNPETKEKDLQNIYLARAPQYRFSAEVIRDNILATSGLLVYKIGGPSVHPYQPAGLWEEASSGRGTDRYIQGKGEALYRKSLYTFWKRTVPPPSMITFDAATRNYCVVKRQTTSTPLQALNMLNDPQFIEAGRVFAQKIIKEGGNDLKSRLNYAFRSATSRYPNNRELSILEKMFERERADFEEDKNARDEFLSIGEQTPGKNHELSELAAYAQVASAIFNLDETITKY